VIEDFVNVGEGTVIHTAASLPTGMIAEVRIGSNTTIEANCTLYSCHIDADCFIGSNSVILEGARLEAGCQIAPNSVVPPGRLIPAGTLWSGNPVEYVKDLDIGEKMANYTYSYFMQNKGDEHATEFTQWSSNYLLRESNEEDMMIKPVGAYDKLDGKRYLEKKTYTF